VARISDARYPDWSVNVLFAISPGADRRYFMARPPSDEQAIERYRYMLRTAPPETIEQAHAEAFAKLSESQRREVLQGLREVTPPREYEAASSGGDPQSLARMATRAEIRQPGALQRLFGGTSAGPGFGSMLAGSLFGSIAGTVLGSMMAQHFLADNAGAEASPALGYGDQTKTEDVESEDFDDDVDEFGGDDMDIEV
jgi:hypothetical protein